MSLAEPGLSLLLSVIALYGVGLPIAWLLPASPGSPWLHRIAVAPLLAILLGGLGAQLLRLLGIPLHGYQLAALVVALWVVAWRRAQPWQRLRAGVGSAWGPIALIGMGALTWVGSLAGYALALPNRDFKNHATFVAQIASAGVADPAVMLRASPVSEAAASAFYPMGLHSLLAWVLPTGGHETVGITAAAAVLCLVVSLPLGVVVLGRLWTTDSRLPWLAAVLALLLPAATQPFVAIGSVTNLVAYALTPGALATLWLAGRSPSTTSVLALSATASGMFLLHLAEALGLAVMALTIPLWGAGMRTLLRARTLLPGAGLAAVVVISVLPYLGGLAGEVAETWDLGPNTMSLPDAVLNALAQQPSGSLLLNLAWWVLALSGWVVAHRRGLSGFVLASALIPLGLSVIAHLSGIPEMVSALTAPWFGTATRIMPAAQPGLALAAALALLAAASWATTVALRAAVGAVAALLTLSSSASLVSERRADMAAGLAGIGDTQQVAAWLADEVADGGGSVLNLEGDGSAMLYPLARVPVLAGYTDHEIESESGTSLATGLLRLSDPEIQAQLRVHDVRLIVLGTSTPFWGAGPGYAWPAVAAQPQVELVRQGSDLVVLRYRGWTR